MTKAMCESYRDQNKPQMRILDKPSKAIIVDKKYALGRLTIPIFGKIVVQASGGSAPERAFEIFDRGLGGNAIRIKPQLYNDAGDASNSPAAYIQHA